MSYRSCTKDTVRVLVMHCCYCGSIVGLKTSVDVIAEGRFSEECPNPDCYDLLVEKYGTSFPEPVMTILGEGKLSLDKDFTFRRLL